MLESTLSEAEARFERRRRAVGLVLAPALLLGLLALPMPGLDPRAHTLAAVAAMTVALWVTEAIPLAATALLGPALAVVLGVAEAKVALAAFGDPLIFLFLGGFLLAQGLSRQRVDQRAALWLVSRPVVGGSPRRALYAVGGVGFAFSMWISNTATTAMLLPVALGLHQTMRRAAPDDRDTQRALQRFGGGMCLALAYACSLGGSATPIGTGPNVMAVGLLREHAGATLGFGTWMAFGVPCAALMTVVTLAVVARAFPTPLLRVEGLTAEIQRALAELGPMRRGERRMLLVFALTVAGWLLPPALALGLGRAHPWARWADGALDEGVVALLGACLLFAIPSGERDAQGDRERLLGWDAMQRIDWGTLLLLGGGFALGRLTFQTGLAEAIGRGVLDLAGPVARHPAGLLALATCLVIALTEVTSNTATTTLVLPILARAAVALGLDPRVLMIPATLSASCAFMMPVASPTQAIVFGSGHVTIRQMVRAGLWFNLLGVALVTLCFCVVGLAVFGIDLLHLPAWAR
ncbi:MAG: DASS family sodium-coupled anion symporter [Myxococcales bacterium]|nr:DASS family sodium-coupled anion symporter [Myxococcales bacterium]